MRKYAIPDEVKSNRHEHGGKQEPPFPEEGHFTVEAECKRTDEGQSQNKEVREGRSHTG
jgi:hypothetical protein